MRYKNQYKKYFYLKSEGFFNPDFIMVDNQKVLNIKLIKSNKIYYKRIYSYGLNHFSFQRCKLLWNYFFVSAVSLCMAIINEVKNIIKNYKIALQEIKIKLFINLILIKISIFI